jgi:hypothetical protein
MNAAKSTVTLHSLSAGAAEPMLYFNLAAIKDIGLLAAALSSTFEISMREKRFLRHFYSYHPER